MKKFIIFIALALFSITSHAQDTSIKKLTDSGQVTFSKVYNDVKGALVGLGAALKVGAEHVYGIFIKQQIINAIVWSVIFILMAIILLKSLHIMCKEIDWNEVQVKTVMALVFTIFSTIGVIVCLCHTDVIVTGFCNPEYGAIQEIMDKIK